MDSLLQILTQGVLLGIALAVLFHNRRSPSNRLWSAYLMTVMAWLGLGFFQVSMTPPPLYLRLPQILSALLGAGLFYWFCRSLNEIPLRWSLPEVVLAVGAGALGLAYCVRFALVEAALDHSVRSGYIVSRPTVLYGLYTLLVAVAYAAGLVRVAFQVRTATEQVTRTRARVIFWAGLFSVFGVLLKNNVPNLLGLEAPLPLPLFVATFTLPVGYSLLKHRAWHFERLIEIIQEKERALGERNRFLELELDTARLIQQNLMPRQMPRSDHFVAGAAVLPMDKVGGDFFDFSMKSGALDVLVADVSGHGIPGAFFASITKICFEHHVAANGDGARLFQQMDEELTRHSVQSMYVTAVYARLEPRRLTCAVAGHLPLLLQRRSEGPNSFYEHKAQGPPLGLGFGNVRPFTNLTVPLLPGDRLLFYTDGLTEAVNPQGVPFDHEHLRAVLAERSHEPADRLPGMLIEELILYAGSRGLEDDVAVVTVDIL